MSNQPYFTKSYEEWRESEDDHRIDAANTFGAHLMQNVRDNAIKKAVSDAGISQEQAKKAVEAALFQFTELLDGYYKPEIDGEHYSQYVLLTRVCNSADNSVKETIELAPEGDGLAMGFSGWVTGDFGQRG